MPPHSQRMPSMAASRAFFDGDTASDMVCFLNFVRGNLMCETSCGSVPVLVLLEFPFGRLRKCLHTASECPQWRQVAPSLMAIQLATWYAFATLCEVI